MSNMKRDIISSAIGIVVLTLLLGILYPLVVTGVSQVAFPGNANGQKVYVDGKLVGSKIIGQQFADPGRQERQAAGRQERQPGHHARPALLPEPAVGDRPARQRRRVDVLQPRPEQRGDRAGDRGQHQGLPGAREAVRPRPHRREGPGRRRQHVRLRGRPRHLGRQRRHPGAPDRGRPSPPAAAGRCADLRHTRTAAGSASPASPASTCSS